MQDIWGRVPYRFQHISVLCASEESFSRFWMVNPSSHSSYGIGDCCRTWLDSAIRAICDSSFGCQPLGLRFPNHGLCDDRNRHHLQCGQRVHNHESLIKATGCRRCIDKQSTLPTNRISARFCRLYPDANRGFRIEKNLSKRVLVPTCLRCHGFGHHGWFC